MTQSRIPAIIRDDASIPEHYHCASVATFIA